MLLFQVANPVFVTLAKDDSLEETTCSLTNEHTRAQSATSAVFVASALQMSEREREREI